MWLVFLEELHCLIAKAHLHGCQEIHSFVRIGQHLTEVIDQTGLNVFTLWTEEVDVADVAPFVLD
jgi:hypothetical protein